MPRDAGRCCRGTRQTDGSCSVGIGQLQWHLIGAEDIVDIATLAINENGGSKRELVFNDRDVDEAAGRSAERMARGGRPGQRKAGLELGKIRLVGDIADRPALRAGPKQRTLRTFQHFDTLKVGHVDVKVAARDRNRCIVKIQCDGWAGTGHRRGLDRDLRQRQAADRDCFLPRTAPAGVDLRQFSQHLIEIGDPALSKLLAAQRLNGDGNILHLFGAARRGNHDIGDAAGVFFSRWCILRQSRCRPNAGHDQRGSRGGKQVTFQLPLP